MRTGLVSSYSSVFSSFLHTPVRIFAHFSRFYALNAENKADFVVRF